MDKYIVVLITAPNDEKGQDIANHLVENHLAACVNIVPAIKSIYRWQEKICQEEEVLLMVKTREALFASIRREIRKIHPYEVPEVISLDIKQGNSLYLEWISQNTTGK